jgi:hypothetical protein
MTVEKRELYSSPNGDRWFLCRDPAAEKCSSGTKPIPHRAVSRRTSASGHSLAEASYIRSIKHSCT